MLNPIKAINNAIQRYASKGHKIARYFGRNPGFWLRKPIFVSKYG